MKILIATTDSNYYLWQMLVQINNFKKIGCDLDTIYVLASHSPSQQLTAIMNDPEVKAAFHLYKDTRPLRRYSSSIRPHILEKFYKDHPEMNNEPILYLDPDVLFTKAIDYTAMLSDAAWHLSDTRSYIATPYIKSKGDQLLNEMCHIMSVKREDVEALDNNAGGAQYLMKGIDAAFWNKCYIDMEVLYSHLLDTQLAYNPENPIQAWCADMWVVLWNAMYFGHEVKISDALKFSWATDAVEKWDALSIFHNAGVTKEKVGYFRKLNFKDETPFNKEIEVVDTNCSFKFLEEVRDTENNFSNLIW